MTVCGCILFLFYYFFAHSVVTIDTRRGQSWIKGVFGLLLRNISREKTNRDEMISFSQVSNHDELLAKRAKSETTIH